MQRLVLFLQESKQEFKRINWPTWQETVNLTLIVIFLSVGMALFLGTVDYLLSNLLQIFLV